MTQFKVNVPKLAWTIKDLDSYSQTLQRELAQIDKDIAALHHGWSGEAATAQAQAHAEWAAGAQNMRHSVDIMRRAAVTAEGNYGGAAKANTDIWGE